MPNIADMQRQDRLQALWQALTKQAPTNAQGQFGGNDPMQALGALGGHPDPYMALRLLQLGQQMGNMNMGPANDPNMLAQLIQAFMGQMGGNK